MLIDDLKRRSKKGEEDSKQIDLFSAFNGLPTEEAKTEFYQHDQNWSNRMILGDSLQVMAEPCGERRPTRKGAMYLFDPPYGIKFKATFNGQQSERCQDGKASHHKRAEQVKAFRDTWKDGIIAYVLPKRLIIARELLNRTGSIFVQIETKMYIRAFLDEIFGELLCPDILVQTKQELV